MALGMDTKGLSSGSNIIYNAWNEQNVYFESSDGHLFNFLNIHGAGAWCGNNVLTIKGYNNGNLVATKSYTLTNTQEDGIVGIIPPFITLIK